MQTCNSNALLYRVISHQHETGTGTDALVEKGEGTAEAGEGEGTVKRRFSILPGRKKTIKGGEVQNRQFYRRGTIMLQRVAETGQVEDAILKR